MIDAGLMPVTRPCKFRGAQGIWLTSHNTVLLKSVTSAVDYRIVVLHSTKNEEIFNVKLYFLCSVIFLMLYILFEIPTKTNFRFTKYPREKKFGPMKSQRHDSTRPTEFNTLIE